MSEIDKLLVRIEQAINETPTGLMRELLCDTNIMLRELSK